MNLNQCGMCQYYRINPEDLRQGICRRYPARAYAMVGPQGPGTITVWPCVDGKKDWCGEYKPRLADA